jgi:hypothetical protein
MNANSEFESTAPAGSLATLRGFFQSRYEKDSKHPCNWRLVILWLVVFKAGYFAVLLGAIWFWGDFDERRAQAINRTWFDEAVSLPANDSGLVRHLATWDAQHYMALSQSGYSEGMRSAAFYPLWPLVIRVFAVFTGGNHLLAGMLLANLFSIAAWTLFYVTAAGRFGERVARWGLVFLIFFPGALFYQFIYSEPLFLLLLMLLWFGLERGRHGLVLVSAFLLPLSRAAGVFVLLPLAWHWLTHGRWERLDRWGWLRREREMAGRTRRISPSTREETSGGRASGVRVLFPSGIAGTTALVAAPVLGLAAYFGLMWSWTGNAFEGIQAQKYWGAHSISNLWDIPKFLMGLITPTNWHEFRGSVLDRIVFIMVLYCIPMLWRLGKDMLLWTYVLGVLPAMSGTFTSFTRFACCAFPIFIALAVFTERKHRGWLRWALLAVFGVLHIVLLWRFVNFRWAG